MGTHPNAILMVVLTPDNLARKTMRQILEEGNVEKLFDGTYDDIRIGGRKYHHFVAESNYEEMWQIASDEGDLVFFDLITYGYGESIEWSGLEAQKNDLELWARQMCEKFNCTYKIKVGANYW